MQRHSSRAGLGTCLWPAPKQGAQRGVLQCHPVTSPARLPAALQQVQDKFPPKPFNSCSAIASCLLPKHFPLRPKEQKRNQKVHKDFHPETESPWRAAARLAAGREAVQGAAAGLPGVAWGSPALTLHQIAMKGFIARSSSPYQSTLWLKERRPFKASLQQSLYFYFKSIWKLKIPLGARPLWRESQACRLAKQPCSR